MSLPRLLAPNQGRLKSNQPMLYNSSVDFLDSLSFPQSDRGGSLTTVKES